MTAEVAALEAVGPGPSLRTRGHARAVATVEAMIAGRVPHALLIGGPAGIGKTTLALDLAAGLLCQSPDPASRPCRACRGCRLVDRGIHPDLHRLAPAGPGDQIRIGSREHPEDGTVRRLAIDLSLLPVEGGARVAIIERADRMGDDAQTALLKTLEEPPQRTLIILCADDEDRLMPTVRSRCARIRLGPVGARDIEAILGDAELADPPVAARLARLSGGRPGLAATLARAPDAIVARDEIARSLLDLLGGGPAARLTASRTLAARAATLDRAMRAAGDDGRLADAAGRAGGDAGRGRGRRGRGSSGSGPELSRVTSPPASDPPVEDGSTDDAEAAEASSGGTVAAPAAERRRAATAIVGVWREVARDLLVVLLGSEREIRDPGLLDDLRVAATALASAGAAGASGAGPGPAPAQGSAAARSGSAVAALSAFLRRLDAAGELLEANVRAELILDTLLLAWPTTGAIQTLPPAGRSRR